MKNKQYEGWLVSNNFWKRAISIWIHLGVIQAIITVLLLLIIFLL